MSLIRIDLGCGPTPHQGYVGVDLLGGAGIIQHDLRVVPWPFEDATATEILAHDVLEHLPDRNATMYEIERILVPGGSVDILVPDALSPGAFQDPTHVSFWTRNTFAYYVHDFPDYLALNKRYGYRGNGFRVKSIQTVVSKGPYDMVTHVHAILTK
jgi:predicted SAM-dependent methyltransferase